LRSDELFEDVVEVSRVAANIKIRAQSETFKRMVFLQSALYGLLGTIAFAIPTFSGGLGSRGRHEDDNGPRVYCRHVFRSRSSDTYFERRKYSSGQHLEQYGDGIFIVARTAQMVEERIAFGETHLFVGRGYVVSVRHGASVSYAAVRQRCEACPTVLSQGEDYIVYAILDFIVDNYMPVVEKIQAEVEAIEDTVLATTLRQPDIERLYMLRRDLLRLRNAAGPLVEVCNRLEHTELMPIDREMQPHFRDVTDHVRRVSEEINALREVLAFAFEASLMAGQAQQTVIARRLAAWAAILAVPTAIAGIYGMNFEHMPELKWAYGYFLVIGVIVAICATLYVQFRRNRWL